MFGGRNLTIFACFMLGLGWVPQYHVTLLIFGGLGAVLLVLRAGMVSGAVERGLWPGWGRQE